MYERNPSLNTAIQNKNDCSMRSIYYTPHMYVKQNCSRSLRHPSAQS
jgi:hypothetical protein